MTRSNVYFPALDTFRAIAVLLVFLGHFSSLSRAWRLEWISVRGLTLFFVLSGFLITYLLLREQASLGKLDIGRFYLRRILRIWPLYYLVILIGIVWVPTGTNAIGYLLFLPNIPFLLNRSVNQLLFPTWSIGAEEQFYLVWPWAIRWFRRRLPVILYSLVILSVFSSWAYKVGFPEWRQFSSVLYWVSKVNAFFYWWNIGYFAMGGLMAYYWLAVPRMNRLLTTRSVQWVALIGGGAMLFLDRLPGCELLPGVVFSVLILQAAQPGMWVAGWTHPALLFVGKISYGMYLFHVMAIVLVLRIPHLPPWLCFLLSLILTAATGACTYRYIESFFLRLRKKQDPLHSGPAV